MAKFIDVASTADINMKFGIISVLMIFNTVLIYYLFIKFIGSFTNNEKWDKDLELTPCILFPYGKNLWERVKPNYQKRYTITERKSMVRSMRLFFWTVILNVLQVFIFFNLFKLFYWDSPTWLTASTAFGINIAYAIMIISGVAFGLFGGVALWGYLLLVFLLLTETSIIKQLITILFTHVVKWKNKAIVYGVGIASLTIYMSFIIYFYSTSLYSNIIAFLSKPMESEGIKWLIDVFALAIWNRLYCLYWTKRNKKEKNNILPEDELCICCNNVIAFLGIILALKLKIFTAKII